MGVIISYFTVLLGKLTTKVPASEKFRLQDGITLYDNDQSPCARRVRITLAEKNIPYHKVDIDLLKGENHDPEFVKISPNRKIPAIAFKNVEGIPGSVMFESSVIIEYLDRVYPSPPLYPSDPWLRAQAKMWMDWELGLVDDHVPVMYANVLPYIIRLTNSSKQAFLQSMHPNMPKAKVDVMSKVYDGTVRRPEDLEKHALASYQNLLVLESALEERQFLVGDRFSVADIAVIPRIETFLLCGLSFDKQHFPNICCYLAMLERRPSFGASETFGTRVAKQILTKAPWFIVGMSNWKCGVRQERFEGRHLIEKAIGESSQKATAPLVQNNLPYVDEKDVTIFDYPISSDIWQIKILLMEKGVPFKTIDCPFIDLIGRAAGSGSVVKVQHGGKIVSGPRTVLEYLDTSFTDKHSLIPSEAKLRAEVQSWQAWEQAMFINELAPVVETFIVSKVMVLRYESHLDDLLSLRSNHTYQAKFNSILQCFMAGLRSESPVWGVLKENYSDLIETEDDRKRRKEMGFQLLHIRLQHLNQSLQEKTYLVGDGLTVADICVFSRLALFSHLGMKISASKYPDVAVWMARLQARQPFTKCIDFLDKVLNI